MDLARESRLGGGVILLAATETVKMVEMDLSGYPRWLVVLGATLVVAFIIWVMIKLLKWALWLLFFGVLIGGTAWALWLLTH